MKAYSKNDFLRSQFPHIDPHERALTAADFDPAPTLAQVMDAQAQPRTRQTFHVNVEQCPNVPLLKKTLDAWRPSAVLLLGNKNAPNGLARELMAQQATWNGIGIYRPFENREGDIWTQRTPREHVNWLRSMALPDNCWVNVGNEPVPNEQTAREKMSPWYAEFTDLAFAAGLKIVIPGGFASGAFGLDAIGPQAAPPLELTAQMVKDGWFDVLLRSIAKYAGHRHMGYSRVMLGAHTYGHGLIAWHTAGRDVNLLMNRDAIQKQHWPTRAQIFDGDESDNWLVLRENWLLNRMRKLENNPLLNVDVAITECWWDRMPNIVQQYPQVAAFIDGKAGREVRGLPTVRGYLAWAFPQWTFAQAVCEQLAWTERVYPAHYRTFVNFAWTANGLWQPQYDWSGLTDVLEEWPKMMPAIEVPASPAETVIVKLLHGAGGLIMRKEATPASENLAEIKPGETVGYTLPTVKGSTVQGNDQWLRIYHQRLQLWGYVSAYYFQLPDFEEPPDEPVDPKDPPVDPPPVDPPPPTDPVYVTVAQMNEAIEAAVAVSEMRTMEFHNAKMAALMSHIATLEAQLANMPERTIQEHVRRLLITEASQPLSKAS
jgi:hypothetical protein